VGILVVVGGGKLPSEIWRHPVPEQDMQPFLDMLPFLTSTACALANLDVLWTNDYDDMTRRDTRITRLI